MKHRILLTLNDLANIVLNLQQTIRLKMHMQRVYIWK